MTAVEKEESRRSFIVVLLQIGIIWHSQHYLTIYCQVSELLRAVNYEASLKQVKGGKNIIIISKFDLVIICNNLQAMRMISWNVCCVMGGSWSVFDWLFGLVSRYLLFDFSCYWDWAHGGAVVSIMFQLLTFQPLDREPSSISIQSLQHLCLNISTIIKYKIIDKGDCYIQSTQNPTM